MSQLWPAGPAPNRRQLLIAGAAATVWLAGCGGDPARRPDPRMTERYGRGYRQVGEWTLPPGRRSRRPVVMLLHGGFWRPDFDRSLERPVAAALARRGLAVWNVDYRGSDVRWPATFTDAAAALDHLRTSRYADRLDLDRLAVVGHSAGGHLALWLASRGGLPVDAPRVLREQPESVRIGLVIGQAPVTDLNTGADEELGGGAVQELLDGEPADVPDRYALSSPRALLPLRDGRVLLVHGTDDDVVPVSQSESYAAVAGPAAELRLLPGIGHFEHLEPRSPALDPVYAALEAL